MYDVVIGEAMKEKDVQVMHVYASPSLRSVETACSMLQGKLRLSICEFIILFQNKPSTNSG